MQNNAIENLRLAKDVSKHCIILIVSNFFDDNRRRLLQHLQKESQWNIVITSQWIYPVIKGIPENQIILLNSNNFETKTTYVERSYSKSFFR